MEKKLGKKKKKKKKTTQHMTRERRSLKTWQPTLMAVTW